MKSLKTRALSGDAGQATLEYVLILMITVIIFLSLVWQFNTAFRKYAEAFFDGYIACLLETGELPGNGGDCEEEFKEFKISNGTVLAGEGISSSGSSSGDSDESDGKDGSGKDSKSSSSKKSDSDSSSAKASNSSELGGSSSSGNSLFTRARNGKQKSTPIAGAKAAGADSNKGREGLTALGSVQFAGGESGSGGRRRRVAMDQSYEFFGEESEEDKALTAPTTPVAKEGGTSLKPKKVSIETSRKPATITTDTDEGFSLGRFVRLILIAGIVVLILIFFGGQILQISKSAEK